MEKGVNIFVYHYLPFRVRFQEFHPNLVLASLAMRLIVVGSVPTWQERDGHSPVNLYRTSFSESLVARRHETEVQKGQASLRETTGGDSNVSNELPNDSLFGWCIKGSRRGRRASKDKLRVPLMLLDLYQQNATCKERAVYVQGIRLPEILLSAVFFPFPEPKLFLRGGDGCSGLQASQ